MAFILILYVVVVLVLSIYLWTSSKERPEGFPPGPPRLPFYGSYWFILKEHYNHAHLAFEKLAKRYNTDILGLYLGDTPCIVPISHKMVKAALNHDAFNGRTDTVISRMRGLGEPRGIFNLDGPHWKDQRWFSLRHLRDFGFGRRSDKVEDFFIQEVKGMIELVSNEPKEENLDMNPRKGVALVPELLYGPLLNTIWLILASENFDNRTLRRVGQEILRFIQCGDATGNAIAMTPWLRHVAPRLFKYSDACEANDYLLKFVGDVIEDHKRTYSPDHQRDFLDVYLQEQKRLEEEGIDLGFNDEQMLLLMLDFMFPAPVAVGNTTGLLLSNIINYPEVQTRIQQEIDQVIGRNRFPSVDDRKSMPFTEATIRESIRFTPGNPLGIPRRCMEDTIFEGYFVPKDTIVIASAYTAHKNVKIFGEEVEKFKPERFLDQNGDLLKKDPTMGFGNGKRLCAGETFARNSMFLMLTGFLQAFNLRSASGKKIDTMNPTPGGLMALKDNYIKFESRC